MRYRTKLWLLWLVPAILALASLIWIGWWVFQVVPDPEQRDLTLLWLMLAAFAIVGGTTVVWAMLDWYCFIPLGALARGARIITRSNPGYVLELPKQHWLGEFPAMLLELGEALHNARRDVAAATATGTQEIEEQKARLETVLRELSEGVLVCDRDARILLYNPAALKLLPNRAALGLGRSLYELWTRAPIESTLQLLNYRQQNPGAGDAGRRCRIRLRHGGRRNHVPLPDEPAAGRRRAGRRVRHHLPRRHPAGGPLPDQDPHRGSAPAAGQPAGGGGNRDAFRRHGCGRSARRSSG